MAESEILGQVLQDESYHSSSDEESRSSSPNHDHKNIALVYFVETFRMIDIRSKYLVEVIKKVNKHPPLQPVTDSFTEQEPYPTLFYHISDIRREIVAMNNEEASDHLKVLDEITEDMQPIWNEARKEAFTNNLVSYNLVWKLFHPGDLVIREDAIGNLWLIVLADFIYTNPPHSHSHKGITFRAWLMAWNEVDGYLTRKKVTFSCAEFSGQRHIKSLPIYPIRYHENVQGEDIREMLAKRGRRWWKLIAEPAVCQNHSGLAFSHKRDTYGSRRGVGSAMERSYEKVRMNGRIVIHGKSKGLALIDALLKVDTKQEYNINQYIEVDESREQYQWDKLPAATTLTDEQAMLCPPVIGCYDLRRKELYTISVDNLQPVKWNEDAMDHLVLDSKKKDMLKGLVRYHSSRDGRNGRGDLIEGKGQSLVILLHGPPGVGKTLTAESTAEAVRKPLISLSIGDMVWDESRLQERLESEFRRATDWDAVLLLDEADVVLEARSFEDVRRNGIVSIFLRQLEYYQGILFLTTNRVSTMDVAFQSRIQVGIGFQSMTPKIRAQVWGQLLTLNGRDKMIGPEALENVQKKLSQCEINGRQIRNVLNVADGLAFQEYGEEGRLKYRHIEEAVKAAVEFQKLLEESKSRMKLEQTVWAPYDGGDDDLPYR